MLSIWISFNVTYAGLVQVRVLNWTPPPQGRVHEENADQLLQRPLMTRDPSSTHSPFIHHYKKVVKWQQRANQPISQSINQSFIHSFSGSTGIRWAHNHSLVSHSVSDSGVESWYVGQCANEESASQSFNQNASQANSHPVSLSFSQSVSPVSKSAVSQSVN